MCTMINHLFKIKMVIIARYMCNGVWVTLKVFKHLLRKEFGLFHFCYLFHASLFYPLINGVD